MSVAADVVLERFRQLRVEDPARFALAPAVIAAAAGVSEEARRRALERLERVAAEQ